LKKNRIRGIKKLIGSAKVSFVNLTKLNRTFKRYVRTATRVQPGRSRTTFNDCTATGTEGDTRVPTRAYLTETIDSEAAEVKRLVGRVRARQEWRDSQPKPRGIPARKRKARVANHRVATLDTRHYFSDALPSTSILFSRHRSSYVTVRRTFPSILTPPVSSSRR